MQILSRCIIYTSFTTLVLCQTLDIETLEGLVIERNLHLLASLKQIDIQQGHYNQSKKLQNPSIEIESNSAVESESSVMVSQKILLGGKRKLKIRLYELELTKSHFEHEKLKHEKLTEAFQSFVEILHLQEIKVLQNNRIFSVLELLNAVSKKVEAGKLSPAEKSRVKIRHFNEQMKLRVIDKSLKTAWLSITTMWGDEKSSFDFAEGDLRKLSMLPLSYSFKNSPLIQFAELSVEIQQNKIKLEKAIAIPNFSLGAGLKQSDIPGNTFQIGLSVPLPIFNRNQENIKSAVYEMEKAELELKATESELKSKIINIQTELELLFSETVTLKDDIIPESLNAYTIITDGYLNGRFTYLDVVDAQKMWFQSREQYLNVLTEYHQKFFELDYLTGNKMHKNFKENN